MIEQRLSNAIDMMNRNELKFRKSQSEGSSQFVSQGGVIQRGSQLKVVKDYQMKSPASFRNGASNPIARLDGEEVTLDYNDGINAVFQKGGLRFDHSGDLLERRDLK